MIEKTHLFSRTDDTLMEKIIDDEHVNINHIVVAPGAAVPFNTKMAIRNGGTERR